MILQTIYKISIPILVCIILLEYTLIHFPSFDLSVWTLTSHTFLLSLIETWNILHILREICQSCHLNGAMMTLQGMVQDSEQYTVIQIVSMAIEHLSIPKETTCTGELAISQVAPMLCLNS